MFARGLGQDDSANPVVAVADPGTGLPISFELGFALLAGFFLVSWAGGFSKKRKR